MSSSVGFRCKIPNREIFLNSFHRSLALRPLALHKINSNPFKFKLATPTRNKKIVYDFQHNFSFTSPLHSLLQLLHPIRELFSNRYPLCSSLCQLFSLSYHPLQLSESEDDKNESEKVFLLINFVVNRHKKKFLMRKKEPSLVKLVIHDMALKINSLLCFTSFLCFYEK